MNNQSKKAVKSIGRSVANINKQIELIRDEYPEANIYINEGCALSIMRGTSHDSTSKGVHPRRDRELDSFTLRHTDCGSW